MSERKPPPTPAQQFAADLEGLERDYQSLNQKVTLSRIRDQFEDVETTAHALIRLAQDVRSKGYEFEPELEPRCLELRAQWLALKPTVGEELKARSEELSQALKSLDAQMRIARRAGKDPRAGLAKLKQVRGDLEALESRSEAAERSVSGLFDAYSSESRKMMARLREIEWALNEGAEASFGWLDTEGLYRAVRAKWVRGKKDEPEGRLFLSDQRLIFERKEEVATKKVLFITTEKELVQDAMLLLPLQQVEQAESKAEGLLGHEDHLYLRLGDGAPTPTVHFHIDGQDSDDWARWIRRAHDDELHDLRVEPVSEAELARLRSAPTQCPNCGGVLDAPILRGQMEIHCEYCGNVTRF